MKNIILLLAITGLTLTANAQRVFTKTGYIKFYSEAPLEKIEAINNKVTTVADVASGQLEFAVLMKAFSFEKALMQEHFNENYVESDKYPKATFVGKIANASVLAIKGKHEAKAIGELTIHGVTKPVEVPLTIIVTEKGIELNTVFKVKVADYKIEIPSVVKDNISKEIEITVKSTLKPFSK